ncbi:PIN domain-containing protein [bacterium]|nr:MAG: PIN domain-containing protein [bacterium]MCL4230556.1 PIN domain-containing protein [Dehalococcoidia bacterium]
MLNLDTHIFVAANEGRLRPGEQRLMEDDFWSISGIVLWELAFLAREGRIRRGPDDPGIRRVVSELTVWPIDLDIARALGSLDFRSDPADEIIAATSLARGVPLLTRDDRLLGSKVVPLALP